MPVTEKFGDRVKRLQDERGLQQKDLAHRAKIPVPTLSDIQNKSREGTKALYVVALADALGVSIRELCTGSADPAESPLKGHVLTDRELSLLKAFRAMLPSEKREIESHISVLAERSARSKSKRRRISNWQSPEQQQKKTDDSKSARSLGR